MYTPGTIVSKFTDEANKNKQKWCYCQRKNFIGTSDIIRHLKTFKTIFDEVPTLLFILCSWYFSCLQIYSEEFYKIYFHELVFFQIFVAKGDICQFFWEKIAYEQYIQVLLTKTSEFLGINILIQKYFSEEWEQIYQFRLKR